MLSGRSTIEVLCFAGCRNSERTIELAREVARHAGLEIDVKETEVATPEKAAQLRFLGSPSVRVSRMLTGIQS
jgi:hypothetical protein